MYMDKEEIKRRLIDCLEDCGIYIEQDEVDTDLREYITDSMAFISTVIAVENVFQIEIPPELLLYDNFTSINAFCSIIEELRPINKQLTNKIAI